MTRSVERIDLVAAQREPRRPRSCATSSARTSTAAEVAEIQRRSDGNPFFIEELLASRLGRLRRCCPRRSARSCSRAWTTCPRRRAIVIAWPSVGGREVEHEMLTAVLDGGGPSPGPRPSRSSSRPACSCRRGPLDEDDAYSFRHALLQEAVYDAMLPTERRRLHRAWGVALEGTSRRHRAGRRRPRQPGPSLARGA